MSEWCLVKVKLSYSKRYYERFKKCGFIKVYRSGHIGWVIEQFSASIYFYVSSDKWQKMVNDVFETCKRKLRIILVKKKKQNKKIGHPPCDAQNNPIFAGGLIFVHVQEKIRFKQLISSVLWYLSEYTTFYTLGIL